MKLRNICLSVYAVVFLSMIVLTSGFSSVTADEDPVNEALAMIDPTDMSQYYVMGEYYPPDDVDTLSIDWQGGRVEVTAYNGSDYFIEEASTRYLQESERLAYSLEGSSFSLRFTDSAETVIDDAYKKVEIRIPRNKAESMKSLNIHTDGEVVLKGIKAEEITINGKHGTASCSNSYADSFNINTTDGNVKLVVNNEIGYSVAFDSKSGKLDSYVDNGLNSYVSGDGHYPFKVKTKSGNLKVELYAEDK